MQYILFFPVYLFLSTFPYNATIDNTFVNFITLTIYYVDLNFNLENNLNANEKFIQNRFTDPNLIDKNFKIVRLNSQLNLISVGQRWSFYLTIDH